MRATLWKQSPLFFGNTHLVDLCEIEGVTETLEQQMLAAVVSFAYTGNPYHASLPQWDRVTTDREPTMIFDCVSHVAINYDVALLALLDQLLPPISMDEVVGEDTQH